LIWQPGRACSLQRASPFSTSASTSADKQADDRTAKRLAGLLPAAGEERLAVLRELARAEDKRFIAPLIDLMRFARGSEEYIAMVETLRALTGAKLDPAAADTWERVIVWYGEHGELTPPPGYTAWKGELHAQLLDPRFKQFLYEGAAATVRVEEVVWGGVKVDGIPSLVNPKMAAPGQADYLVDSEPVFGVAINGDARAYPLRILDWHEMANDVVGGKAVALAYCTLCGAGVLYDATVGEKTFQFGSSGFLFLSNKLMYDRETNTLWNQLTGEPVIGKLAGSNLKLKTLPVVLTSWGEWKRQRPETRVLDLDTGYERPYRVGATYGRYFASPGTMFPVWRQSSALPRKARIYALQVNGIAKAYPLDALNRAGGVANDSLGGQDLVVVYRDAVGRVPLSSGWVRVLREFSAGQSFIADASDPRLGALRAPGAGEAPVADANDWRLESSRERIATPSSITHANNLTLAAARAVLQKHPELIRELTVEMMLAMPAEARLTLLDERTSDERMGTRAEAGRFTPDFRNEVAQRGLIGETRAYERGNHTFRPGKSKDELIDERRMVWRVTEDSLISKEDEKLPRLGGHLAYWFGWFAFFPQTKVFTVN
jgi:hypothetical protein